MYIPNGTVIIHMLMLPIVGIPLETKWFPTIGPIIKLASIMPA